MLRSLVVIAVLAVSMRAHAQVPVTRLAPADARFTTVFQGRSMNRLIEPLQSVHELSDGRVLIRIDQRVVLSDPKTGRGERRWDSEGILLPVNGDTSVLVMRANWRFFVRGALVSELPATHPLVDYFARHGGEPRSFDTRGFVYTELPGRAATDSQMVMRINRQTGSAEVFARLHMPRLLPGGVCVNIERAGYFADGWIAMLRDNPYRVDWLDPTGRWVRGTPIATRPVPVTEAEKKAYHAWEGKDRDRIFPDMELKDIEWPKTMCPWHAGYQPMEMPDGRVMIFRVPNSTMPASRYDVINRRGVLERQIAMAPNEAIIGFGKRSIYVRTIDGAIATVSRHPIDW